MGPYVAQRLVKLLVHANIPVKGARVGVMGLTFKENVADIRNSKVPDIIEELKEFGIEPKLHDPFADPEETKHEYGLSLVAPRGAGRPRRADPGGVAQAVPRPGRRCAARVG